MISKTIGLTISEIIYLIVEDALRNQEAQFEVDVDVFNNCRERGYVYKIRAENGKSYSWCTYEHRNSDEIIINGSKGYWSGSDIESLYQGDKYQYLANFDAGEYQKAATKLVSLMTEFWEENESKK